METATRKLLVIEDDPGLQTQLRWCFENYDVEIARYLVQGVDVWLNNPQRMKEASGTSGMKAAANGVLNLSIGDGWWPEAFNGENGWAVSNHVRLADEERDVEVLWRIGVAIAVLEDVAHVVDGLAIETRHVAKRRSVARLDVDAPCEDHARSNAPRDEARRKRSISEA